MQNFYKNDEYDSLTPKEIKVLKYLIEGLDNDDIAKLMRLSIYTVKAHVSVIIKKFNAKNRTQAACRAILTGYIEKLN